MDAKMSELGALLFSMICDGYDQQKYNRINQLTEEFGVYADIGKLDEDYTDSGEREKESKTPVVKPSPFTDRKKYLPSYQGKAFSGKKRDKIGREQCYQEGMHIPCVGASEATQEKPKQEIVKPKVKPKKEEVTQEKPDEEKPKEKTKIGPSKPDEREEGLTPPALEDKFVPPAPMGTSKAPKNAEGRPVTGYTANGMTNTAFGDLVEKLSSQLNMRSILPEGKRSNKNVKKEGSSIDVEWDHSGYAFEVKGVTVESTRYKAGPKEEEVEGKKVFAKMHDLKPAMMIVVTDITQGKAWAYWQQGIGSVSLNPKKLDEWNYAGEIVFDPIKSDDKEEAKKEEAA